MLFVTFGGDAVWPTTDLTYSYSNLLTLPSWNPGTTIDELRQAAQEAMGVWASVTPLKFFENGDTGPSPSDDLYDAADHPDIRWGHHLIDGPPTPGNPNTLAHAYRPGTNGRNGDIHFDNGDTFTVDAFLETATHEIGHALGLDHPNGEVADYDGNPMTLECPPAFAAIMHACIGGGGTWDYNGLGTAFLLQDDIDGIRSLYGSGLGYVRNRNGELHVYGTAGDDTMSVTYASTNQTITVVSGFSSFTRTVAGVSSIHIHGMQGADTISVRGGLPGTMRYVIDGGPGNDTLTMAGSPSADVMTLDSTTTGKINGTLITFANIESVTMSGFFGSDTFNISALPAEMSLTINGGDEGDIINLAPNNPSGIFALNGPITVNGGSGGDTLNVGSGGLHAVSGLVTFNAGALNEGNSINLDDSANSFLYDYTITNTSITHDSSFFFGGVNYSGVDAIALECTQTPNTVRVTASDVLSVLINGNGGNDHFFIGDGIIGTAFFGDGGDGIDEITFDDHLNPGNINWFVEANNIWKGPTTSTTIPLNTFGFETVNCLAGPGQNQFPLSGIQWKSLNVDTGGGNDTITFASSTDFRAPASFNGGTGADSFVWTAADNYFDFIGHSDVQLDGGAGAEIDVLSIVDSERGFTSYNIDKDRIRGIDNFQGVLFGADLGYAGFESVDITASNFDHSFVISGTPSSIPVTHQMSILGGSEADSFVIHPRDAQGNLTINGNLGINGGGGLDTLVIDDTGSSLPINYTFYNQFGPGTTNIGGLGAAGFGAASNIESITINAGDGGDTFNINSFQSGSALAINGGGGADTVNFGVSNVTSEITSMSSFHYDGQGGSDTFKFNHAGSTASLTYFRDVGATSVYNSLGQVYGFTDSNIEVFEINAGTAVDALYIDGADPGLRTVFNAGDGIDSMVLGLYAGSLENIRGPVVFHGGPDGGVLGIEDSLDTTGDIVHIDQSSIGAKPGDTLFGPGGSLTFSDIVDAGASAGILLFLGSGADTVFVKPLTTARVEINAGNPTSAPGDSLRLNPAGVTSLVFTPEDVGAGTYSFANAGSVSYTGFESAIAAYPGDYDLDGTVGPADYAVWKAAFGTSVVPGTSGDGNGDGIVDVADYTVWRDSLGAALPAAGSGIAMPEAGSIVMPDMGSTIQASELPEVETVADLAIESSRSSDLLRWIADESVSFKARPQTVETQRASTPAAINLSSIVRHDEALLAWLSSADVALSHEEPVWLLGRDAEHSVTNSEIEAIDSAFARWASMPHSVVFPAVERLLSSGTAGVIDCVL